MNLQKETHSLREQIYGWPGRWVGEGIVKEFGMDRSTLLYLKLITITNPFNHTGVCVNEVISGLHWLPRNQACDWRVWTSRSTLTSKEGVEFNHWCPVF